MRKDTWNDDDDDEQEQGEDEKKCPACGNENLLIYQQVAVAQTVSARTGKVLKHHGFLEVTCWNLTCKCGWVGELKTQ